MPFKSLAAAGGGGSDGLPTYLYRAVIACSPVTTSQEA
uniref:Uncharacterized protein n=1 Tax=Arundo donax TaxID=35708 RepID=A0A0A9HFC0_ARUDO